MSTQHLVEYQEKDGKFVVYRIEISNHVLLAEFSLADFIAENFESTITSLAGPIGEILVLDTRAAVRKIDDLSEK